MSRESFNNDGNERFTPRQKLAAIAVGAIAAGSGILIALSGAGADNCNPDIDNGCIPGSTTTLPEKGPESTTTTEPETTTTTQPETTTTTQPETTTTTQPETTTTTGPRPTVPPTIPAGPMG